MARKSRWQQFTDNFNGVYDTFNKLGQNIETKRIMGDDFTAEGGAGAGLSGADLERARYKALGDVYTKYGNAEAGLNVRNQLATLEAANRDNQLNQDIYDELVKQRGVLQSGLMGSQINSNNASANASNASAANTRFRTSRGEALLPGELTYQGLQNQGQVIANNQATENLSYDIQANPERLRGLQIGNDQASYNLGVDYATRDDKITTSGANADRAVAEANQAETAAEVAAATSESNIDATNTGNEVTAARNNQAMNTMSTEDSIIAEVMALNLDTPEATQDALLAAINNSQLPLERRIQLGSAIQKYGLETLMNKGATFTQEGLQALGKGLDAGIEWYDTQDDGNTLEVIRENGTVRVMERRGDAINELYSASGPQAEQEVIAHLGNIIKSPTAALSAATSMAELESTRANTDRTNSQTTLLDRQGFTELLNQDAVRARTALVEAQMNEINNNIQNKNLTDSARVGQQALSALMSSDLYLDLANTNPAQAAEARADIMRATGLPDAPPAGMEALLWFNMTDDEKAAFN